MNLDRLRRDVAGFLEQVDYDLDYDLVRKAVTQYLKARRRVLERDADLERRRAHLEKKREHNRKYKAERRDSQKKQARRRRERSNKATYARVVHEQEENLVSGSSPKPEPSYEVVWSGRGPLTPALDARRPSWDDLLVMSGVTYNQPKTKPDDDPEGDDPWQSEN